MTLAAVVTTVVIGVMGYLVYTGNQMTARYAPLSDAANELKLEATTAHLWFEEILSGDRNEDIHAVWHHINRADWYAHAMLHGGSNDHGTYFPLRDQQIRQEVEEARKALAKFRSIAVRRYDEGEISRAGSPLDQEFDAVFGRFIDQADKVEDMLKARIAHSIAVFRTSALFLIGVIVTLSAGTTLILYRLERRRAWDMRSIQAANRKIGDQLHDLREGRRKRDALREAKETAEAASQLKSRFLAHMSHEMRTPLNGMLGTLELLLNTNLIERQRKLASTAHRSGRLLLQIISDILDLSKVEAGKLNLVESNFNLGDVMEDVADLIAPSAHAKGLEFIVDVDPGVPVRLRGDMGRLRQVLMNLLGNAVKFTQAGEVVLRCQSPDGNEAPVRLRFEIADTGIGLAPAARDRIFESFEQADASTTRRYGGTGLGLTISRQLAELMGGDMGVRSQPGEGSTFWVTLPFGLQDGPDARVEHPADLQDLRALVVDDNDTARAVLCKYLASLGVDAYPVENAPQALDALRESARMGMPYNLCLVDQHMPGTDGAALLTSARADPGTGAFTAMLLTSDGAEPDELDLRRLRVEATIAKPVHRSRLLAALASRVTATPGRTAVQKRTGAGMRVLVAEDNPVNAEVAAGMLGLLGCRVDVVVNGRQAVDAFQEADYDLVLIDCEMPEMDGFEATASIRRMEADSGAEPIPIIAVTAHAMKGDKERFLNGGMNDYLSKPVTLNQLGAVVERWLGDQASAPEPSA